MEDNEAIFITNIRRFSKYKGYTESLEYDGPFDGPDITRDDLFKDFIVMDA